MKKRIAVLVSGGGTNLQALLEAEAAGKIPHGEIAMVISNNPNAYALERARNFGVPAACINKKELGSQAAFEAELQAVLERNGTDLIILAGFMCILSENFTSKWPKRIINVHPALIPSFCGVSSILSSPKSSNSLSLPSSSVRVKMFSLSKLSAITNLRHNKYLHYLRLYFTTIPLKSQ